MEFDYGKALKRTKISKSDIEKLRLKVKELSHVPKKICDKKVKKNQVQGNKNNFFSSLSSFFAFCQLAMELRMQRKSFPPTTQFVNHPVPFSATEIQRQPQFSNV
jgi:hypothetical protein